MIVDMILVIVAIFAFFIWCFCRISKKEVPRVSK